jgi:hypothetical protein
LEESSVDGKNNVKEAKTAEAALKDAPAEVTETSSAMKEEESSSDVGNDGGDCRVCWSYI